MVRVVFVYHAGVGIVPEESGGEMRAYSAECGGEGASANAIATDIGNGDYAFTWNMPRLRIPGTTTVRSGRVMMAAPDDQGGYITQFFPFECTDGPQSIVDTVDCAALPVESKTWGAIKALYQSRGVTP
jgi:hypothetical protein